MERARHVGVDAPRKRSLVLAAAVLLALAAAAPAVAQNSPPAVWQYVEVIPTGGGAKPVAGERARSADLPDGVGDLIADRGGGDAEILERIATSSALGAPQEMLTDTTDAAVAPETPEDTDAGEREFDEDSVVAAGPRLSPDARLAVLAVLLMLVTATMSVFARLSAVEPDELDADGDASGPGPDGDNGRVG